MKYELQTIPVWKAIEADPQCILCHLAKESEQRGLTFFLGNSIMAPEMRVKLNERGFCGRHFHMLAEGEGKLGYSLALATHFETIAARQEQEARRLTAGGGRAAAKAAREYAQRMRGRNADCLLCERIEANLLNFSYTICRLFADEPEFRAALRDSHGICLRHLPDLVAMGAEILSGRELVEWHKALLELEGRVIRTNMEDLEAFTWQFDYQTQKKTPEHAKDAIARAVQRLAGYRAGT